MYCGQSGYFLNKPRINNHVKLINAQKAKYTYTYKNTQEKLTKNQRQYLVS